MTDDGKNKIDNDDILSDDDVNFDDNLSAMDDDFDDSFDKNAAESNEYNDYDVFDNSFDGDDDDIQNQDYNDYDEMDYTRPPEKNGVNWFNIGIIGAVIIAIGGLTYVSMPGLFNGTTQQAATNTQPDFSTQTPQTAAETEQPSLFENSDILGDDLEAVLLQNAENTNEIFDQVDNTPTLSNEEMNELFAVIATENAEEQIIPDSNNDNDNDINNVVNTLPLPSDSNSEFSQNDLESLDSLNIPNEPVIQTTTPSQQQPVSATPQNNQQQIAMVTSSTPQQPTEAISALNTRMDEMSQSMTSFMDRLENRLNTLSKSPPESTSAGNSDQLKELQQTINRLESRIDSMDAKQQAPAQPSKPKITVAPKQPSKPVIKVEQEQPKQQPQDVLTPIPTQQAQTVKSAPKRAEPAYSPPKVTWELRGASNGQAVLAQRGTQNLQTISIGSTLRDLGRVTSIAMENNRWVVRTTNGIVRQ